ncbi:MAG: ABC transporter substrate-binding protein [Proteobacteria bacterium]|nr:ABC transporter substrate-binding protein [Pseudomonadota bacterium]
MSIKRREFGALAAGAAAAAMTARPAAAATKTLRYVRNGNLTILDPIWTTAYVTRDHGYMVYDTLFAVDEHLQVKPQMVDKYEVSADKLTWTFTLRDGLEWHDGKPVTSADCVPSLKRWMARDPMGQKLKDFVADLAVVNDKTFTMKLKEPYGLVLDSLGKPSSNTPFMMPKAVAETDPFKQIDSTVGSGPFIYVNAESKPGDKHVYVKNPKYKPRAEPPSGFAGAKVAKVDRIECPEMPDPQQQVNALIAGEIDVIEQLPHDLIPLLNKEKSIKLVDWNPLGQQFIIRFNHLQPPFNDPKIRLAALYCMRQEDYLKATIGDPKYYKVCSAAFICGTPNAVEAPNGMLIKPDFEKSKALLKEAGYDGKPVVLMQSTTLPVLTNTAPVTKALLEQGGFKVDMQSMDWQTLVTRRTKKDPPDKGGWNVFHTYTVSADALNPISNNFFLANGDHAWFGWPTDPEMEKLRDQYARETDPAKSKELAAKVQARALETAQYGWIGQWYGPGATRANVSGWLKAACAVMWNVDKA